MMSLSPRGAKAPPGVPHAGAGVFVEGKRSNQRLWRAIIGENGGGAGRFVGAFATGDRAEADKPAVARNPDWESGPRCI